MLMTNNVNTTRTLPQLAGTYCIADGGLETWFVFQKSIDLPLFAAFTLLDNEDGVRALQDYYTHYIELALDHQCGIVLDTPTWRASNGWGRKLGYDEAAVLKANLDGVQLLADLRNRHATADSPMVISGAIGPQDDGYQPTALLSAEDAKAYHQPQVDAFRSSEADMVSAITMTYAAEAIGIANAAKSAGIPVAISFTVETDGRLPDGSDLGAAITEVDAETDGYPAYFMINCAHPTHFMHTLDGIPGWANRIVGVRANASCKSHAELDESTELDAGNPVEFGSLYAELGRRLPNLRVAGGCCGTDHRHIGEVCRAFIQTRKPQAVR